MKTLLATALLLCLYSTAHAQTAFDTLRKAFYNASMPATTMAFDQDNWSGCAYADVYNPNQTRQTMVRVLQYSTGAGNGPLFPGDSGYRIDVFQDHSVDRNLASFFQSSRIIENESQFVQTLSGPQWRSVNIYGRVDTNMLFFQVDVAGNYNNGNGGGMDNGGGMGNGGGMNGGNMGGGMDSNGYQNSMNPRVYGYCWNDRNRDGDGNGERGQRPPPIPFPN